MARKKDTREPPRNTTSLFILIAIVLLAGGFIWWQSDLVSDPPMYYAGQTQSLSTDPAMYTHHARNEVLFGAWDPFDNPRWTVFQHSLTSLTAWLWFSVTEPSLRNSNMVGVLLCLGAVLFFALGLWRHYPAWVIAAFVFLYVANATLLTYGRLSYLENGLIFVLSVAFAVYCWFGRRPWGLALTGVLIAVAALTGKIFAVLVLPALLLAIFFGGAEKKWRDIIYAGIGFAVGGVVVAVALYGSDLQYVFAFAGEQSVGLHGFPDGLKSPWGFFEKLIDYGYRNRLYRRTPEVLVILLVTGLSYLLLRARGIRMEELNPLARLVLFLVPVGILGLMPHNYAPLRYSLFMIPFFLIGGLVSLHGLLERDRWPLRKLPWIDFGLLFFLVWVVIYHVAANAFYFKVKPFPGRELCWVSCVIALVLAYGLRWWIQNRGIKLSKASVRAAMMIVLAVAIAGNVHTIRRMHVLEQNYNFQECNRDIATILGPNAVLSGPYGPVLTVDNTLRSLIHIIGVAELDDNLFDRFPITHLAVDVSNWSRVAEDFPQIEELHPMATYWMRDYTVNVFRISDVYQNAEARRYQPTAYERAADYFHAGFPDSAMQELAPFYRQHPYCKAAGLLMAELYVAGQRYVDARKVLIHLANAYATDFNIQVQCARFLQQSSYAENDPNLLAMARQYYERAVRVNRFKGYEINNMYNRLHEQNTGR